MTEKASLTISCGVNNDYREVFGNVVDIFEHFSYNIDIKLIKEITQ